MYIVVIIFLKKVLLKYLINFNVNNMMKLTENVNFQYNLRV